MHEVDHDVIPTADNGGQIRNSSLNQVLGIAQPNVRSMGKAR